uniref:ARAD1D17732p n=1 Tax=Blastobotrys adeninivorans TaxID=409370 RepID=A0A060TFW2_BLAAD
MASRDVRSKDLPPLPSGDSRQDKDKDMRRRNRTSKISVRMVAGPGSSYGHANESTADSRAAAAVVQQEMNNVQKLKRLSLGATSTLDPDLPSQFAWYDDANGVSRSPSSPSSLASSSASDAPPVPPKSPTHASSPSSPTSGDGPIIPSHAAELLWVPANVHPELAPQEWKSFVQHKVAEIRQKTVPQSSRSSLSNESTSSEGDGNGDGAGSGGSPSRSPSASSTSSLSRRNSLLSRQVRSQSEFRDGSDIIEERRTSQENNPQSLSRLSAQLRELGELESLAMDPFQLARSLSYGDLAARNNTPGGPTSPASAPQSPTMHQSPAPLRQPSTSSLPAAPTKPLANDSDEPILAAPSASLRRSARTRYNKPVPKRRQVAGMKEINERESERHRTEDEKEKGPASVESQLERTQSNREHTKDSDKRPELIRRPSEPPTAELPQLPVRKRPSLKDADPELYKSLKSDRDPVLLRKHSDRSRPQGGKDRERMEQEHKEHRERELKEHSEREHRKHKEHKEHRGHMEPKEREPREPKEPRESRGPKEPRESREPKESNESRAQVDLRSRPKDHRADPWLHKPESRPAENTEKSTDIKETTAVRERKASTSSKTEEVDKSELKPDKIEKVEKAEKVEPKAEPKVEPKVESAEVKVEKDKLGEPPKGIKKKPSKLSIPDTQVATPSPSPSPTGSEAPKQKARKGAFSWLFSDKSKDKHDKQEPGSPLSPTTSNASVASGPNDKETVDKILARTPGPEEEEPAVSSKSSLSSFFSKKKVKKSESSEDLVLDAKASKKAKKRSKSKSRGARANQESDPVGGYQGMPTDGRQVPLDPQTQAQLQAQLQAQAQARVADIQLPYHIPPHQMSDKSMVMLYHRYPLHVERAIYRLSHIKLANPKRPLAQQVLLSNFMYAYLNLINHGYQQQQLALQMQQMGAAAGIPVDQLVPQDVGAMDAAPQESQEYEYEYEYDPYEFEQDAAVAAAYEEQQRDADSQSQVLDYGDQALYSRQDTKSPSGESSSSSSSSGGASGEDMWLGDDNGDIPEEPPESYYMPQKPGKGKITA